MLPFASPNIVHFSVFAGRDVRDTKKSTDYVGKGSLTRARQEPNGSKASRGGFRVNVPIRSAPTSPFSSPALSPRRCSAADTFLYYPSLIPKENQAWSAPEIPTSGIGPELLSPAHLDYFAFSCDDASPLHSPRVRSPRPNPKSPTGPVSPLHFKLSLEALTGRRESNCLVNFHPLPLPPGAAMSSPSSPIPQAIVKSELVPMNSQWQKGKIIGRGTFGSVYVATNRYICPMCFFY